MTEKEDIPAREKCRLAWSNLQPIPEDVGKPDVQYFTHQMRDARKRALTGLRKSVKASLLRSSFGYPIEGANMSLVSAFELDWPRQRHCRQRIVMSWGQREETFPGCQMWEWTIPGSDEAT
jgi:hypothetical protein